MEEKFIDIFTGLKRDYGYADINSAFKDPATGKLKLKYGWAAKELADTDYLDHLNGKKSIGIQPCNCLLYTSPSPRDGLLSRMPSSA